MDDSRAILTLDFDLIVYRLSAVKKAAYKFGDRCHIEIFKTDEQCVTVKMQPKRLLENLDFLAGDFRNEVLDQELREQVALESEPLRNLIIAQAFSQTALLDPIGEDADFREDPLNIAKSSV